MLSSLNFPCEICKSMGGSMLTETNLQAIFDKTALCNYSYYDFFLCGSYLSPSKF